MRARARIGERCGYLTVIGLAPRKANRIRWFCRCDCGNELIVEASNLRIGHTESCGCYHRKRIGDTSRTHGLSKTREHKIWQGMRYRCSNKDDSYYGGRNIKVCPRWDDFELFLSDMGKCPAGMSIERLDVDKDYEPSNCIWLPVQKQSRNKRNNVFIEAFGTKRLQTDWARILGVGDSHIRQIIRKGWSLERFAEKRGISFDVL